MRPAAVVLVALAAVSAGAVHVGAEDERQRIGPIVFDVHALFPSFPDDPLLAQSRSLSTPELPGQGLGASAGFHFYPFKWKGITFGLGGEAAVARARSSPDAESTARPVTERFATLSPQLSFNFAGKNGWSYISGGIGRSIWSVVPDGEEPQAADRERIRTLNYGAGARWFARRRLAYGFDVRFYALDPGTPFEGRPGSPRTTLIVVGGGISIK